MPFSLLILALASVSAPPETAGASAQDSAPETAEAQRPTVHLVVDEVLARWLVVRLLEDGYPLTASPAAAHAQLAVVSTDDGGWRVTATGESSVAYDVEPATDEAVLRLELLHRSLDALEDVVPAASVEPQPATVALAVDEPSLAPQVAAGILAAGATLVPAGTPAALRVCADQPDGDGTPRILISEGKDECAAESEPRSIALANGALSSTTEMVSAAMASLEAKAEQARVEPVVADPEPATPTAPKAEKELERPPGLESTSSRGPTPLAGAPSIMRLGVATGFVSRGPAVDALVAASMTFGKEPGFRGWLELQARPVTVVGPLRVVEVNPAIGFKIRPLTVRRVSLETGLLLGADIHSYQLRGGQLTDRGTHTAASLESALGVAVAVWKRHEVHAAVRVGGGMERVHRVQGQEVWRRAALRIGLTVGFSFGLEINR